MKLTPEQKSIRDGESGGALALAMKTLISYGETMGAERMVPITSGHLAGSFGIIYFKAYIEILERLIAEKVTFKVPTTVNPRPGAEQNLLTKGGFLKQHRLESCLERLGVTPNYSCVCYDSVNLPELGDCLGWAESSAVQYANSVLGARVNRNSLLIDVCSSVTGYTPEFGYLLDENRRGQLLVKLDVQQMDAAALGFILGRDVVDRVPVIENWNFSRAELKNMGGAMAASGAVALFHVEGLTPEAPDLKTVFDGDPPETITVSQADLDALSTKSDLPVDLVVFGCPQLTYEEAEDLGEKISGVKLQTPVWFCMIPEALERFRTTELFSKLSENSVTFNSYCPLAALSVRISYKRILTNSGKLHYYLRGADYGKQEDCLHACGAL